MLIISRKKDQKIVVADDIEITILEVGRNRVRFGIKAPKHVPIQTRLKTTPVANPLPDSVQPIQEFEEVELPRQVYPAVAGSGRRR